MRIFQKAPRKMTHVTWGKLWNLRARVWYFWNTYFIMFKTIPCHHFYNVHEGGIFGRHFIISLLSYNAEYWIWNANAILKILTCSATLHFKYLVRPIYIFITSCHVTPVAQSISTVVFVGWRSMFTDTSQYHHIFLDNIKSDSSWKLVRIDHNLNNTQYTQLLKNNLIPYLDEGEIFQHESSMPLTACNTTEYSWWRCYCIEKLASSEH